MTLSTMDRSPVEMESGWPRVPGACFVVCPWLHKFSTKLAVNCAVLGETAPELRLMPGGA